MAHALGTEDYQRIDAAVTSVERRTAAEFAVVTTRVSDRYSLYPLVWAQFAALMVTGIAALVWPRLGIRAAVLIQVPVVIALWLLFHWLPIRLLLVPKRVKHAHARQLAQREFSARVVGGSHRNRILLFVSLAERYVEIIADRGTHALAPEGTWDKIVGDFLATVKAGHVADGILAAIEACGVVLETHHPPTSEEQG